MPGSALSTRYLPNRKNLQSESSNKLSATVARQQEEISEMREQRRRLEAEIANVKEQNDLLEFQLVELTEGSQKSGRVGLAHFHSHKNDVHC